MLEGQREAWLAASASAAALKEKPQSEAPPEALAKAEQELGAAQAVVAALEAQVGEVSGAYGKAPTSAARQSPFHKA